MRGCLLFCGSRSLLGKTLNCGKQFDQARAYMDHVIDQAITILKHRSVSALFTTPKLLEALAERKDLVKAGIKGVFCGGTTMDKQYARFLVEEVCEGGQIDLSQLTEIPQGQLVIILSVRTMTIRSHTTHLNLELFFVSSILTPTRRSTMIPGVEWNLRP